MKNKNKWLLRALSSLTLMTLFMSPAAQAAILFQDDDFHDIPSEAILIDSDGAGANDTAVQFGNDGTASENGVINWNITTNTFEFDHTVAITGGVSATGNANFSGSSEFHVREEADEATATCTTIDEVILDTAENRFYICTATGSPGTWIAADVGSADDFESVYATDADDTLTTGGGNFTVATGGGNQFFTLGAGEFDITSTGLIDFNADSFTVDTTSAISLDAGAASNFTTSAGDLSLTATAGSTVVTGGEAVADAVQITASNAAGGVDVNAGTGGVAIDTTGALSFDGVTDSNFSTTTGDITLSAGDDLFFDDAQLTAPVQLTDTATAIAATYGTSGIIDALNSITSTATGAGASNVGIEDAGAYFTGTDVEGALQELGASAAQNYEVLNFSPEYPDAVLFGDGTANRGRMDALYDSTNEEHYYQWTTRQPTQQDYDIRFRFPLPEDFTDVNDFTFRYRTGTVTTTDNKVDVTVRNDTDNAICGTSATLATANAWATGTITEATLETGCTAGTALGAGDIVEVIVKLYDILGGTTFANIGVLSLGYDN